MPNIPSDSAARKHRNEVKLSGVLARNPEIRYTTSGKAVGSFTVATTWGKNTDYQKCVPSEEQRPVDTSTLALELADRNQLDTCGGPAYLGSLLESAFPTNFAAYVRQVTEAARDRRYSHLYERLADVTDGETRLATLELMQEL